MGIKNDLQQQRAVLAAGGLIVLAGLAVYANSLSGPFIFDDVPVIRDNPALAHLWPLGPVLSPHQGGMTTSGRPLLNLSLALNHAFGGVRVWGYHATNLAIHLLAGLALFGIARRTLARWRGPGREGSGPLRLGFLIALIWTVHPLNTEAVTYMVQRAESLMGLCYLLTLYCFIRGADQSEARRLWLGLSVLAGFLGMAAKEVMVSAPVIVLLYDRTFVTGTFREAWRRRSGYYLALAAAWIPLAWFVLSTKNRGGTAGLDLHSSITAGRYWLTQFPAIALYLKLAVWPRPLALDYGAQVVNGLGDVLGYALAVAALAAGSLWLLLRRAPNPAADRPDGGRALGFCGCFFFSILAPTSLIPVISQTVAEHRMYLALAPLIAAAVGLLSLRAGRFPAGRSAAAGLALGLLTSAGYGALTVSRNRDYRSEVAIWSATVWTYPLNARTQYNLGIALHDAGDNDAAIAHYQESLRLNPTSPECHNNWGVALIAQNRWPEARVQFDAALRLKPDYVAAIYNLGNACLQAGELDGAVSRFEQAIRLSPAYADAYYQLGTALLHTGRGEEALAPLQRALQLKPDYVEAHLSFGIALGSVGRLSEAIAEFERAARLRPDYYPVHLNLGHAYQMAGRMSEASAEFQRAAQLNGGRLPGQP